VRIRVGAAAVGNVAVGATPSALPWGGGAATIVASVLDTTGNPLPGVPVTFAIDTSSNGTAGGNGTLSAAVVNTDQNGRAQTTLTTNRTTTVSATAGFSTTSGTTTTTAPIARVTITANTTQAFPLGAAVPNPATAGQSVSIPVTPGTSTTASSVVRLVVNWGDGRVDTYTGLPGAISHVYGGPGSFLVSATGFDALGDSTTTTASVTVNPRAALTVTITPPGSGVTAGVPATFGISVAGLATGAAVSSVRIDFGDGTGTVSLTGNVTSV